jgi:transcriptional regulator with XRE-family HTH domain
MSNTRDEQILIDFGKHLQKIRDKKEISLRKLEGLSEEDHSEIHRIEKGIRSPSLTTIQAIADGLGIDPCELLTFKRKYK